MDFLPIRRAILSVTDKNGLEAFAAFLVQRGVELVSTGGTCAMLRAAGLAVTEVSRVTGFPEIMNGRVKTLHPAIHGGILADKDKPEHLDSIAAHGITAFDLVCVNLYDFAEAAAKGLAVSEAIEQIDIGGPCMLRAAAKNFHSVLAAPAPAVYPRIMADLAAHDMRAPLELRRELAAKTFAATSVYDGMIAAYLEKEQKQ